MRAACVGGLRSARSERSRGAMGRGGLAGADASGRRPEALQQRAQAQACAARVLQQRRRWGPSGEGRDGRSLGSGRC